MRAPTFGHNLRFLLILLAFALSLICAAAAGSAGLTTPAAEALWADLQSAQDHLTQNETAPARAIAERVLARPDIDTEMRGYCRYLLGTAAYYELDFPAAREHFSACAAATGTDWPGPVGFDMAAACLRAMGDLPAAIAEYETITRRPDMLTEGRAGARFQIGDILYENERFVEARYHFARVLDEYPQTSWVASAKESLAGLDAYFRKQNLDIFHPVFGPGPPWARAKIWASPDQSYWVATMLKIPAGTTVYLRPADFLRRALPAADLDAVNSAAVGQLPGSLVCRWDLNYSGSFAPGLISRSTDLVAHSFDTPGRYRIALQIDDYPLATSYDDTPAFARNIVTIIVTPAVAD